MEQSNNKVPFIKTTAGLIGIIVTALIVGGLGMIGYQRYKSQPTPVSRSAAVMAPTDVAANENIVKKGVGDDVTLQTIKLRVNQVIERGYLSGDLGLVVADKGAHFAIVNLSITDLTDSELLIDEGQFGIVDDKGRHFSAYSNIIGHIDNYFVNVKFSPSITKSVNMVFEVPNDATSYYLPIAKGGTDDVYQITLK